MKNFLIGLCLSGLVGCSLSTGKVVEPEWYTARSLEQKGDEYIGYGQALNSEKAALQAKSNLALSIQSKIKYSLKDSVETTNKTAVQITRSATTIESSLTLSDIVLVKKEKVGDTFFVAYKYSNLPLVDKIVNQGIVLKCTVKEHPYLSKTPLIKSINKKLFSKMQQSKGCHPRFEVVYKHDNWYLLLTKSNNKTGMFLLTPNDFKLLFASIYSEAINLHLSQNNLQAGELYHINLNISSNGYLSLFYISSDGQLLSLIENKKIDQKESLIYPDLTQFDGLIAETYKRESFSQDLVLAAQCDNKEDFSSLPSMSNSIVNLSTQRLFQSTMDKIEKCAVSTKVLNIIRKQR